MISDGNPFPSPSSAPAEVTDTVDTINPALMILNAVSPSFMITITIWDLVLSIIE